MAEYIQVVTTTEKKDDAQKVATFVIEKRLAGCVQIIGPITSTFWWKDNIEIAEEWICVIKSRLDLYPEIEKAIRQVHPYEVPEILGMPIISGSKDYLKWLSNELKTGPV